MAEQDRAVQESVVQDRVVQESIVQESVVQDRIVQESVVQEMAEKDRQDACPTFARPGWVKSLQSKFLEWNGVLEI